ncbi:hypothetical protein ASPWEDRAFT_116974 [Aspergillus wentii DTO 134E9]|uniref:ribonuclease T2 n=1 Tax=Aspergillus wentii DTO 134E9 TaxID=1073089 RepID=A0A1L9RAS1_ASPWE|nr:uncharacterized protein ASPWEDRAFT_116974 [Aspergillus wentii DTO 134E9]KAI9934581.1 ribonuclease T2-like [Aspergillus wentii]OJJ32000.1 hypothetical protein ASPWEDRAFT_116974 [Aspergillus wentii DTO 134E9]
MFSLSKGTIALAIAQLFTGVHAGLKTCTDTSNLSCHNSTAVSDLCCFNSPGGTLMQVQFWDTDPSTGPSDSWTIHGLWPDHCDGGYGEHCDDSREVDDIESVLKDQGRTELLDYMQTYWISDSESNNKFWAHEWNTHGTCVNTIDPSCYTDYAEHEEVGDFFEQVVTLFKDLDTYTALSKAGITPTNDKTYTAKEIQSAVGSIHDGYEVTLLCNDDTLYEIEYYFNVYGSAVGGKYVATSPLSKSGCPSSGIKYPPKDSSSN